MQSLVGVTRTMFRDQLEVLDSGGLDHQEIGAREGHQDGGRDGRAAPGDRILRPNDSNWSSGSRRSFPPGLFGTVLLARGSSDHAAVYGRYDLELASGRPVSLAAPSLHTLYGAKVDYRGYLAVAVSQSGRTPEIVTVLEPINSGGARCLAVTNEPDSPLGDVADMVLEQPQDKQFGESCCGGGLLFCAYLSSVRCFPGPGEGENSMVARDFGKLQSQT